MKTKLFLSILFTLIIFSSISFGQNTSLYPFKEGKFWGYLNSKGKTVIKPQFYSAGQFSQGLAPVRLNGTYGFINQAGAMVIKPIYDLAFSFESGIAKVFIDGKPFCINLKGNILFQHNYANISPFYNRSYAVIKTWSEKYGIINKQGKLLVDTIFKNIGAFSRGVAPVEGLNHNPYYRDSTTKIVYEYGVIDTLGHWIVNYGTYKSIGNFINGFAEVELIRNEFATSDSDKGIVDTKGNYRFTTHFKKWHMDYTSENFSEDIAIIDIYSVNYDSIRTWSSNIHYDYRGAVNPDGKILFSNPDWYKLTSFNHHRAFAQDKNEKWVLINTKGELVTQDKYDKVLFDAYQERPEDLFANGIAFVKTDEGWGAIDTMGKYVIAPKNFSNIEYDHIKRRGNVVVFEEDISVESEKYSYRYGFWNIKNNAIVKPKFHDIDFSAFNDELIAVNEDGRSGYINQFGEQVWKEDKVSKNGGILNIDFMNRGYYYASSEYKSELAGYGGWGGSGNKSKLVPEDFKLKPNQLQVIIDPSKKTKWAETYEGIKLYVVNNLNDTSFFDAQDSRLYLKLQAQDRKGEWKDIEYLPSSWCGNSYHTMFLASKELWEFSTPIYTGEFKTKIRAKLESKKTVEQKENDIIYSNEIDGAINPGQFWNKRDYYPRGLMDPYND